MLNKSKVAFRIGFHQWSRDDGYERVVALCEKFSGLIDEVAFFNSESHSAISIERSDRNLAKLVEILPRFRDLGMSAGVNVLATTGHHDENLPNALAEPWQKLVGPDGDQCEGCFCVSDESVQQYISDLYASTAKVNPDFIWMDDDVRTWGHMPILCSCFCDLCMANFSRHVGETFTRSSVLKAFADPDRDCRLDIRKKWLENNRRILKRTVELAERGVSSINDKICMGFMSGEKFLEGYDLEIVIEAMKGSVNRPVRSRPGGGFWDDFVPADIANKGHAVGRQVSRLPDYVMDIQAENESFPHQKLMKSVHVTTVEAAVQLAAGSTGTAFNILNWASGCLEEYFPFLHSIQNARPFYDKVVGTFQRNGCEGLWFAWNKDAYSVHRVNEPSWLSGSGKFHDPDAYSQAMYEIGIPPAYGAESASVTALAADTPLMFTRDEIRNMLSGGLLIDGPALQHLSDMGFDDLTGFKVAAGRDDDTMEVLAEHPLNGPYRGARRDCRQSFKWWWAETAWTIEPVATGAEILASTVDYEDQPCGHSMGIYENALGGRVCVSAYFPWKLIYTQPKTTQLKNVVRWLSRDTLPATIESCEKVNLWTRQTADGRRGSLIFNASFDPIDSLDVAFLTDSAELTLWDMKCQAATIQQTGRSGPYMIFSIPHVKPWTPLLAIPS
jgi:hypothetical protein